ncbi:hypothetical protein BT93_E2277 [Corymbia citriodora subsp. variegata]|nr:hypothetical protein BT93_E2277 [Corymbia citriodora subsp. variegata]
MDNAGWRPMPPGGGGGGGIGAAVDDGSWRVRVQPKSRERILNKIVETLQRHLPVSSREGLQELNKIALRIEGNIYTAATSLADYIGKIRLTMLKMETESQSSIPYALPSNAVGNSCEDSGKGKILKTPPSMASINNRLRPKKRARLPPSSQNETRNPVDCISQLPNDIIFRIFSFLTTKDAIKTSVLSKRWRSTWTANQYMSFSLPLDSSCNLKSFVAFVNSVLLSCTAIKVKRFLFNAPCLAFMQSSLDTWLQFAIMHNVEEVSITPHYWRYNIYSLPQILFHCTTLESLCVSQCCFSVIGTVNWCSLKILRIEYAELNDEGMVTVLSGSPVLEFLELKSCRGIEHIMVESKSLRELVIDSHEFRPVQGLMLKIWAPHLLKLRLLGNSQGGAFSLDEVSSLIEAELNFDMESFALDKVKAHGDLVKGLLKRLHHVMKLVMGSWCLQIEFNAEGVGFRNSAGKEFWNSAKWRICQCLMHLKHVEIVDRGANLLLWEPTLSLLKFLLQNALRLDKIVINSTNSELSDAIDPWLLLEVARILLSFPKCSPSAKVILRYPSQGCPSNRVRES